MKQKLTISLLTEAKDGSFGKNEVQSMTRTEAVERMAKAIFQRDNILLLDISFDELEQCTKVYYLKLAEFALDALLGGKK